MQPLTLSQIVTRQELDRKAIRRNKAAKAAVGKAKRKLRQALKASDTGTIRILLGMAQTAIDKAETSAQCQH